MTDTLVTKNDVQNAEALLSEFEKVRDQYQKLISEKGKQLLAVLVAQMFDACPNIEAVGWEQYTPYFNDGEECVFSVCDRYFSVKGTSCESSCEEDDFDESEKPGIDNFSTDPKSYFAEYERPRWGSATDAQLIRVRDIDRKLSKLDDAIFKDTFGDHVSVRATRTADGGVAFEVTDYEHE